MKKLFSALLLSVCLMGAFTSVASAVENATGLIFKDAYEAGGGSGSINEPRSGSAICSSYFALVALGNCTIKKAMENGNISKLSHYDTYTQNILGFRKIKITAYGE